MDVFDVIDRRASPKLAEPGPDAAQRERMLRAGVRAQDHGMLAPWRFVTIQGAARARLGDAMAALRRDRQPEAPAEALALERAKAFRAPLILVVVAEPVRHPKVPEIEQVMAVAACAQNIVLAAAALGFAAVWKTGPAAYDGAIRRMLGVSETGSIVAFLYIGTPADGRAPRAAALEGLVSRLEAGEQAA